MTKDDATIIVLLIGEASGVFAGFCPSWFTVSSPFFHEQDAFDGNVKRIRWGEIAATAIVVGTGAAVSMRSDNNNALVASIAIAAVFVGGYEYMIRHPSTGDTSTSILPGRSQSSTSGRRAQLVQGGPLLRAWSPDNPGYAYAN